MMERRVRGNSHARCEAGEKVESGADAPLRPYLSLSWRPSDLEQRAGRTVRQGNENPVVGLYRYVTEEMLHIGKPWERHQTPEQRHLH